VKTKIEAMSAEILPDQPTSPYVIHGVGGLRERAGSALGTSRWVTIDQDMVTAFANLSGDRQWIHIDPERARQGPFGATVAHGFFTLSLSTDLLDDIFTVDEVSMILNYGLNRVRFPAPVPVGSRLRLGAELEELADFEGGGQATLKLTFEVEGASKPSCVAHYLLRFYN
jgi:acyl dehydratase